MLVQGPVPVVLPNTSAAGSSRLAKLGFYTLDPLTLRQGAERITRAEVRRGHGGYDVHEKVALSAAADLPAAWRTRAAALAPYAAAAAAAFEAAAEELTRVIHAHETEPLTLDEAAAWSGYSTSQIRRLYPGRRTVPRGWLPRKPRRLAQTDPPRVSSRSQAARDLLRSDDE